MNIFSEIAMGWISMVSVFSILVAPAIIAWCFLCKRLGYDATLGLLMLIPVANVVLFFWLAFSKSPLERRFEDLMGRSKIPIGPTNQPSDVQETGMPRIDVD